jgi:hypothetical protein
MLFGRAKQSVEEILQVLDVMGSLHAAGSLSR